MTSQWIVEMTDKFRELSDCRRVGVAEVCSVACIAVTAKLPVLCV